MLLNGLHLLPDPSGAVVWPARHLLAAADGLPAGGRELPGLAAAIIKRLTSLLRQRRPQQFVWLGTGLARALADGTLGRRETTDLARLVGLCDWVWVGEDLPADLPGRSLPQLTEGGLSFRVTARAESPPGEIAANPSPRATSREAEGPLTCPCFVIDGRRLLLPGFGPTVGTVDVLSSPILALYRRPFQVVMLPGGRILTRPRARLMPEGATTTSKGSLPTTPQISCSRRPSSSG